jgi:hypothetical protein
VKKRSSEKIPIVSIKKGDKVKIEKIEKFPDERDSSTTYYMISGDGKNPSPKLDSGLDFI